uniref:Cadherin domain-containing protein n=1 Tax=Macrostomum lignano TaxID=282301 RepID=A0A1I8G181_9PLAT
SSGPQSRHEISTELGICKFISPTSDVKVTFESPDASTHVCRAFDSKGQQLTITALKNPTCDVADNVLRSQWLCSNCSSSANVSVICQADQHQVRKLIKTRCPYVYENFWLLVVLLTEIIVLIILISLAILIYYEKSCAHPPNQPSDPPAELRMQRAAQSVYVDDMVAMTTNRTDNVSPPRLLFNTIGDDLQVFGGIAIDPTALRQLHHLFVGPSEPSRYSTILPEARRPHASASALASLVTGFWTYSRWHQTHPEEFRTIAILINFCFQHRYAGLGDIGCGCCHGFLLRRIAVQSGHWMRRDRWGFIFVALRLAAELMITDTLAELLQFEHSHWDLSKLSATSQVGFFTALIVSCWPLESNALHKCLDASGDSKLQADGFELKTELICREPQCSDPSWLLRSDCEAKSSTSAARNSTEYPVCCRCWGPPRCSGGLGTPAKRARNSLELCLCSAAEIFCRVGDDAAPSLSNDEGSASSRWTIFFGAPERSNAGSRSSRTRANFFLRTFSNKNQVASPSDRRDIRRFCQKLVSQAFSHHPDAVGTFNRWHQGTNYLTTAMGSAEVSTFTGGLSWLTSGVLLSASSAATHKLD